MENRRTSLVKKLGAVTDGIRLGADLVSKVIWTALIVIVAAALVTNNSALLARIVGPLVGAGITKVPTPIGDLDLAQVLARSLTTVERLGVHSAVAGELADRVGDATAKQELKKLSESMKEQLTLEKANLKRSTELLAQRQAAPSAGGETEAWIYLGRLSEGDWRPPSFSIATPKLPVAQGSVVTVTQDALVYESMDCKVLDVADFNVEAGSSSVLFVRASQTGLQVLDSTECSSAGKAKTVWAKVKIPNDRLIRTSR